jgi:hypothetical protein
MWHVLAGSGLQTIITITEHRPTGIILFTLG